MGAFPSRLTDGRFLRTARFPILCFTTMEFQTGGSIEDSATAVANVGSHPFRPVGLMVIRACFLTAGRAVNSGRIRARMLPQIIIGV